MPERRIMREVFSRLDDVTQKGRDISDEPTAQLMPEETTTDERAHDTVVRGRVLPTAEERAARKIKYKEPPKNPREPKIIDPRNLKKIKPRGTTWVAQDSESTTATPKRDEQKGRDPSTMLRKIEKIPATNEHALPNKPDTQVAVAPDREGVIQPSHKDTTSRGPRVQIDLKELPGAEFVGRRIMADPPTERKIWPGTPEPKKGKRNPAPVINSESLQPNNTEPPNPPKKSFFRRIFGR